MLRNKGLEAAASIVPGAPWLSLGPIMGQTRYLFFGGCLWCLGGLGQERDHSIQHIDAQGKQVLYLVDIVDLFWMLGGIPK